MAPLPRETTELARQTPLGPPASYVLPRAATTRRQIHATPDSTQSTPTSQARHQAWLLDTVPRRRRATQAEHRGEPPQRVSCPSSPSARSSEERRSRRSD